MLENHKLILKQCCSFPPSGLPQQAFNLTLETLLHALKHLLPCSNFFLSKPQDTEQMMDTVSDTTWAFSSGWISVQTKGKLFCHPTHRKPYLCVPREISEDWWIQFSWKWVYVECLQVSKQVCGHGCRHLSGEQWCSPEEVPPSRAGVAFSAREVSRASSPLPDRCVLAIYFVPKRICNNSLGIFWHFIDISSGLFVAWLLLPLGPLMC